MNPGRARGGPVVVPEREDLTARVGRIEAWAEGVSALLVRVESLLENRGSGDREEEPSAPGIQRWSCSRCSTLLGIVDVELDEIRIRHQKHVAAVKLTAPGAYLRVVCVKCGAENRVEWQESWAEDAGGGA